MLQCITIPCWYVQKQSATETEGEKMGPSVYSYETLSSPSIQQKLKNKTYIAERATVSLRPTKRPRQIR